MRSCSIVVGTLVLALVFTGCASSPPSSAAAPPVHVVVTADEDVRLMVNADKLKRVTEEALRKYASNAGEATVTIHFKSLAVVSEVTPGVAIMPSTPNQGTPVAIASSEPWNEPSRPTVGGSSTGFTPTRTRTERPVVKGWYTITDPSGTVLEQKSIAIPPNYRDGYSDRLNAQRDLAADVAKRVAALRRR